MDDHEKAKRGKLAEVMYELLDFGRMEQLAADVWARAPENVKNEVAAMFATMVKTTIVQQVDFIVDPQASGGFRTESKPKNMMQSAFEAVATRVVNEWIKANEARLREDIVAAVEAQMKGRAELEAKKLVDEAMLKMHTAVRQSMGRGY